MNITEPDITKALDSMSKCILDSLAANDRSDPVMIGIHTGGAWVAEALKQRIDSGMPFGTLDISFYRDDFTRIGMNPQVKPSNIPFDIDDRHIILVDDVLYSGRTIRAALNELFDYGRPASVSLIVLVERDGRQLPIAADCTGMHVNLDNGQQIKLSGPEPLMLEIIEAP
ncbi:MAG: bifunctional pyr operon transcriptional regulator/uracil phosphoribosyltransferase PyrR [Gammaproteobacteria bacterium]|nr:MAG: bifunctional pyr operon transcriptional regulator/uracil phosphoribosyltransferase PyrR [Gammaproteobacteria bacterium]